VLDPPDRTLQCCLSLSPVILIISASKSDDHLFFISPTLSSCHHTRHTLEMSSEVTTQSQKDQRSLETVTTSSLSGDDYEESSESKEGDVPPPTKCGCPKKADAKKKNPLGPVVSREKTRNSMSSTSPSNVSCLSCPN
jgi:hypothetical protein